jgi:hypothetical protein
MIKELLRFYRNDRRKDRSVGGVEGRPPPRPQLRGWRSSGDGEGALQLEK